MLGESFSIFDTGRIANSGGYSTPNKITFTLIDDKDDNETNDSGIRIPSIKFRADWIDEDGRAQSIKG